MSPQAKSAKLVMDEPVEPLAHDNDEERQCQERQSGDVSQAKVVRKEIAHVCAENAGEAERRPVSHAERGQVNLLHGTSRFLMPYLMVRECQPLTLWQAPTDAMTFGGRQQRHSQEK